MCIKLFIHSSWISPTPVTSFIWSWASGTSARPRHVLTRPWAMLVKHQNTWVCPEMKLLYIRINQKILGVPIFSTNPNQNHYVVARHPVDQQIKGWNKKKLLGHVCTNAIIQSKSSLDFNFLGWSRPWLDSSARIETPWRTLHVAWHQKVKLQSRGQQVS